MTTFIDEEQCMTHQKQDGDWHPGSWPPWEEDQLPPKGLGGGLGVWTSGS